MSAPSERWLVIRMVFFNAITIPWQLVMSTLTLFGLHSDNIISTLETEAVFDITDGIILWATIDGTCAAHGILELAASINQTII